MTTVDHEIELDELPESKMFMKNARFSSNYSKRKHVMSGFRFRSKADDIKFGKFCVGDADRLFIRGDKKIGVDQHASYAYPNEMASEHDMRSLVNLAVSAIESKEPRISCAKSTGSKDILCLKVEHVTDAELEDIDRIAAKVKRGSMSNPIGLDKLYDILNPDMIKIDMRTRRIIMSVIDGETEYSDTP